VNAELAAALEYAGRGWRVFPCNAGKIPLIKDWGSQANSDRRQLEDWWGRQWPRALVGYPTGAVNDVAVLDVDVKRSDAYGPDTLADLGFAILPATRTVHTRSGGIHLHFRRPAGGFRNTAGARGRGIGGGLDWRSDGGFVVLPSPSAPGYVWDPHLGIDAPLADVPPALLPREPERRIEARPIRPASGLAPYSEAALDSACRLIILAPSGTQRDTLNAEAFSIGTLAGSGAIPESFARQALIWAAQQMPSYDPARPWRDARLRQIIDAAFADGLRHPRGAPHG
jgi:hypothetical protein